MNPTRAPAALAATLLLATLSLTACVHDGTVDAVSPAGTAEPAGPAEEPDSTGCNPDLPEPAYDACITNDRADFPRPPVQFQHSAE